jgi:5-methylcytosine-specific restriction endonuclease McrA
MRQKIMKLIEELSVNFSFYRDIKLESQLICPICLKPFDTVNKPTEAHIIPEALGGNVVTLACNNCNNSVGSDIESYEVNRVKFNNAFSGSGQNSWKAQLSL